MSQLLAARHAAGAHDMEMPEAFREAMSQLAAGVVMVTTRIDAKPWGLTVSACCSVSIAPPMLLVSLGNATASRQAIELEEQFGVSILGVRLIELARFGASKGAPKFVDRFCEPDDDCDQTSTTPVVANAIAHVDCRLAQVVPAGDHTIFLGVVRSVLLNPSDRPLVYHARTFHRLLPAGDLGVGPAYDDILDSVAYPPW